MEVINFCIQLCFKYLLTYQLYMLIKLYFTRRQNTTMKNVDHLQTTILSEDSVSLYHLSIFYDIKVIYLLLFISNTVGGVHFRRKHCI